MNESFKKRMKNSTRRILILMLTVLFTLNGYAAVMASGTANSAAVDGIKVSITADKAEYTGSDKITVTITAENTNTSAVKNVAIEDIIPKGYSLEKNKSAAVTIGTLAAGESASLKVTLVRTGNGILDNLPKTGDTTKTILYAAVAAIALIALIICAILLIRRGKGGRLLSLLLILALTASLLPAIGSEQVYAAGSIHTITVATGVRVDGQSLVLYGNVYYTAPAEDSKTVSLSNLTVNNSYVKVNEQGIVHFTVKATGNPEAVDLFSVNGTKIASMNDKGKQGDAYAGDGIYSVTLKLLSKTAGKATYHAVFGDAVSNQVVVSFYEDTAPEGTANGIVSGTVCDEKTKKPLTGATVSFYGEDNNCTKQILIGENDMGAYEAELPAGSYVMVVTADGYRQADVHVTVEKDMAHTLDTLYLQEIKDAAQGSVTGRITDSQGQPLAGALITIRSGLNNTGDGEPADQMEAQEDGSYIFTGESGYYTITAEQNGYVAASLNVTVPVNAVLENCDIALIQVESESGYTIVLTWGETPKDLDAHVKGKLSDGDSFHVYFNRSAVEENGSTVCELVSDSSKGYGPETIVVAADLEKPFYYYVQKYDNSGSLSESGAIVSVYKGETLLETYQIPTTQGDGKYWNVFAIAGGNLVASDTVANTCDLTYADAQEEKETEEKQKDESGSTSTEAADESAATESSDGSASTEAADGSAATESADGSASTESGASESPDAGTEIETVTEYITEGTSEVQAPAEGESQEAEQQITETPVTEAQADEAQADEAPVTEAQAETPEEAQQDTSDESSFAGELEHIQSRGVIYIGVADSGSVDESGRWIGDDSDRLYNFAESIGVTVTIITYGSSSEVMDALETNDIDMVWNGLNTGTVSYGGSKDVCEVSSGYAQIIGDGSVPSESAALYGFHKNSDLTNRFVNYVNQ